MVREDLPALVLWVLEGDGTKDLLYPFGLVHLEFYQRCQQALQRAECWVQGPRTLPERRAIDHLATSVHRFDTDGRFTTAVTRLEGGWQAFCELRDVLQLSNAELPRADVRAHQREFAPLEAQRMHEIKAALRDYRARLAERIASPDRPGSTSRRLHRPLPCPEAIGIPSYSSVSGHCSRAKKRANLGLTIRNPTVV